VDLLWSDIDEKTGKKNLRNALYQIRKAFDLDIVISPQRTIVMINPEIEIHTDFEDFEQEGNIKLYSGEFLKGLIVKDAIKIEEWILIKREYYKELYIKGLYIKANNDFIAKQLDEAEKNVKKLIELDEFNEKFYRMLMNIYIEKESISKAITVYNKLTKILERELGVVPEVKTTKLLEEILSLRNIKKDTFIKIEDFFYGRQRELQIMLNNHKKFISNLDAKAILLLGEAGIGKTKLKNKFLSTIETDEIYLLETNCYQAEKNYFFKPWYSIFTNLWDIITREKITIPQTWTNIISCIFPGFSPNNEQADTNPLENIGMLKYQVVEDAIIGVLNKVSKKRKIILVLDDIQWIDKMSLSLLRRIILQDKSNIIFIGTCRKGHDDRIEQFIVSLSKYNKIEKVNIDRFTNNEVMNFIDQALSERKLTNKLKKKIVIETEGNTFFLVEFLNSIKENYNVDFMTSKMQDILKSRFLDISDEGKKILNIISLFFDGAPIELLEIISGKDELEIIDLIEELEKKNLIKEKTFVDEIRYKFTHQKLREFVYTKQSATKRRILHNKIAGVLEKGLKGDKKDISIYSKLIYHFSNGEDRLNTLKYTIKNLNVYLDFSHELFPILNYAKVQRKKSLYLSEQEVINYMRNIEKMLIEIKEKEDITSNIYELEIDYLHIKGRYLIREGRYKEGIKCIVNMINYSGKINNHCYILKGYKQMIYYCIQTYKIDLMKKYIKKGLIVAREHNKKGEIGILLRLDGLNQLMIGDYESAERLLKKSIETLKKIDSIDNKYALNIAASYNYIGEIRRHNMEFSKSLYYYDKAIKICKDNDVLKSKNIFNINAGQSAFEMGDYFSAKNYFINALEIFNELNILWERSIGESYMALILVKEGNYSEALKYLKRGIKYSKRLKNPYELGIVYRVMAEIKVNMKNNDELTTVFKDYVDLSVSEYCSKGIELFSKVKKSYEIDILKVLERSE